MHGIYIVRLTDKIRPGSGVRPASGGSMSRFTTLVLLTACAAVSGWPQLNRGTLTGIISDPSGAVVPGVVVKAIHVDTGTTASTVATDTGNYTLPGLQIGTYRVEY